MEPLLPHYERELAWLRKSSAQFAQSYPRIAGRLQLAPDMSQDPHVERMIESFALLSARVHKRLDDDFPLFTESLLEVLYPHYLRPFPSCSIACFELGPQAAQMTRPVMVARGASLSSRPVKGVACKFQTTQPLALWPIQLSRAQYRNAVVAPPGTPLPEGATSVLSITLDLMSPQARWAMLDGRLLRLYLDGEASLVSALREALSSRVVGVMTQWHDQHPWVGDPPNPSSAAGRLPQLAGFAEDEALVDADARSHPAYRLLTEYFAFPDKFNFIDLPVPLPVAMRASARATEQAADPGSGQITVHVLMGRVRADSDESRLLESVQASHLRLGCSPVVNLFRQAAEPIRITHTSVSYPVLVDARRAWAHEVHQIERVFRVRQSPTGDAVDEFKPFFSLKHADLQAHRPDGVSGTSGASSDGASLGLYWHATRDEAMAEHSPGHETELSLVDIHFDPRAPQTDTLSLQVKATNRDLPTFLPVGAVGGDLFLEGGSLAKAITLLRKPSPTMRIERGRGALWRLISHLSLNHLSLSGGGVDALQEMLRLYDLPRSSANARQLAGIVGIEHLPATAWLPGQPFATFVRGTEVRLQVDEHSFVGSGLGLFAAVMERFYALYVHANSFTQLTVVSARTQEVLIQGLPRNGGVALV